MTPRRLSIAYVQHRVAVAYGIDPKMIVSARQARRFTRPRQVAVWLCSMLLPCSLPQLGRAFGGRDHTTMLHAIRVVENLRAADPAFRATVDALLTGIREDTGAAAPAAVQAERLSATAVAAFEMALAEMVRRDPAAAIARFSALVKELT